MAFSAGDRVEAAREDKKYAGALMPSTEKDITMIKLDNGYNIGLKGAKLKKLGSAKPAKAPTYKSASKKGLPTVALITTGGTITSRVDYQTGGVRSLSKPEELLASIPELAELANLKVINPFNVMSEDMTPEHWVKLAKAVVKELNDDKISGVIVTHGTDILHWTAAALSFLIDFPVRKPVALVGGQRSSDRGSFDGAQNLICAIHYCLSDIAAVSIVMHESSADEACIAIRGTKARKMHCSRRDAFRPINELPLARIFPNGKIEILARKGSYVRRGREEKNYVYNGGMNSKVALVNFAACMSGDVIDYYVKEGYSGIIIAGEGLGHVTVNGKNSWIPAIKRAVKEGVFIGMTSQCLYGRVNPHVYTNLILIEAAGAVFLKDMLPETAYVKLMWALANSKNVKSTMLTQVATEFNPQIGEESYLY